ncbi:hypothetical protein V5F77_05050 [Xanthobacter sp. DSM 24535]|uniref:DUF6950 family protein n=1 Tax=Roseixanthobacter psychrophilus TaxID=3119917 RepID=UPI00372973C0
MIDTYRTEPFSWGVRDCFTLPMDAVCAQTGSDPWADERSYTTRVGAARKLSRLGFSGVGDAFAAKLLEIHPVRAGRGDIGVALAPDGQECGVVVLGAAIVGISPATGLTHMPRSALSRAFKVV